MGWRLAVGIRRQGVDDFAGLGVVKLFARFVLDGAGVGFETIHMIAQVGVLLLQILRFRA